MSLPRFILSWPGVPAEGALVSLEAEQARHLGVSRQALVKVWIANCLARDAHSAK